MHPKTAQLMLPGSFGSQKRGSFFSPKLQALQDLTPKSHTPFSRPKQDAGEGVGCTST